MAIKSQEEANAVVREFIQNVTSKKQLSDPQLAFQLRKAIPFAEPSVVQELAEHLEAFPHGRAGWGADDDYRVLVYDCHRQLQQDG